MRAEKCIVQFVYKGNIIFEKKNIQWTFVTVRSLLFGFLILVSKYM